jgi:hypothetical protein
MSREVAFCTIIEPAFGISFFFAN